MRWLPPLGRALVLVLLLVLLAIGKPVAHAATPGILITEVQAANTRTVADDQGGYSDWIELHNPTDTPVPLLGYTLTDDPTEPTKWALPVATLAPGAFLVVWASGLDQVTPEGWHTSFRLNRAGDYVGLFAPGGLVVDEVTFEVQEADVSLGRLRTVSNQWMAFPIPTPGAPNSTAPTAVPAAPALVVTPTSGLFAGPVTAHLEASVSGGAVYYTLDGSDPTVDGQAYIAPLEMRETTVLRAVALHDGVPVSAVTTATYLVGESTGLPVLSLVTDPAHLWDEATGIYVNAEERGRGWERPVTMEWLSPEGEPGFNVGAGLRIHGGGSRKDEVKQSFRLYFRGEYGPRMLEYPLFGVAPGQTYDRLVLRAGHNDGWPWSGEEAVYVRDQLVRDLHGAMGQVAAQGRWVTLYLNGAYWGLYNLTERIDEAFLATHFDHDDWDLARADEEHVAWDAFVDWITGADLSAAAQYERAVQQLDIENFTSYFLLNIWAQNRDWPRGKWIMARPREGTDTRWRLFVWDAEVTFGPAENTLARVITNGSDLEQVLTSLLKNAQYRAYFAAELERHLTGVLSPEQVLAQVDALEAAVRPAMGAEAQRWVAEGMSAMYVPAWERALTHIRHFVIERGHILRTQVDRILTAFAEPLPLGTRIALLVHHPAELAKGDTAVVAHLTARGAEVTLIGTDEDSAYDPEQVAAGHDLLLVSSSIGALSTAARYAQTTTPLIFWEPRLLKMRRVPLSPQGGTRPEQTSIRIVDADHPVTAGLPVDQRLRVVRRSDTLSVAYPPSGPGVHVLARHLTGGDAALMVAEAGAELSNGQPAQARTVFMFWHHDTFHWSTGAAVRLFDRAVNWALGLPADRGQ